MEIETVKNTFLDTYFGWEKYKSVIPISDHTNFTRKRFLDIEGSSSVLVDSNFSYFVYTIPFNILISLIFYVLFRLLQKYEISKYFRKYYFVIESLTQVLIEGNIIYFSYVTYNNFSNSWTINFMDKVALLLNIIFFFFISIFSLTYYFLVGKA